MLISNEITRYIEYVDLSIQYTSNELQQENVKSMNKFLLLCIQFSLNMSMICTGSLIIEKKEKSIWHISCLDSFVL